MDVSSFNGLLRSQYSFVVSDTFNGAPFGASGQTIYDGFGNTKLAIQASSNTVYPVTTWTAQ